MVDYSGRVWYTFYCGVAFERHVFITERIKPGLISGYPEKGADRPW